MNVPNAVGSPFEDALEVSAMVESRGEVGLLADLRSGHRAAAERLVDDTYSQVYASLFRLTGGDREMAADLTQECYRRAWGSLPRFEGKARLSTWLYRIAYNTFLHHVRRPRRVEPSGAQPLPEPLDPAPIADEGLASRETAAQLRRAVLALPDLLRFTVTARFWGELEVEQIARLERVTGAAIRKRLKKALGLLRATLEEIP